MKYHRIYSIFVVLAIAILNFFPLASGAQARKIASTGTLLKIELPKSVKVAESMLVDVQLTTYGGEPIANQTIHFYVDGVKVRSAKTNFTGRTSMVIRRDQVGTYLIKAVFSGSRTNALTATSVGTAVVIKPAILEVQTLPALPGIKFSLGGQVFSSDADGIARVEVSKIGTYRLEVLPMTFTGPDFRAKFSRWGDQTFFPYRDVTVPNTHLLQAGFDVSYLVSHNFTNLQGNPVDPSLITSMSLKGSNGKVYDFSDNQPVWLQSNRVVRLGTFQETKILYSVETVEMKGSNVVSNAQQRFFVHPNDTWTINLLLYTANFTARDMLFNFPIKSQISLEFPNGQIQALSFGKDEIYTAGGLPRGNYRATAFGAWGLAPSTPIALSRNQNVELQVVSYLDMMIVFILGLSLVFGLLFIGRPEILSNLVAVTYRISPGYTANWSETFQIWRQNLRFLAKSSSYIEVSPEISKWTVPEQIEILPEQQAVPLQIGSDNEEGKDINSNQVQIATTATCPVCGSTNLVNKGKTRRGRLRVHCDNCGANRSLKLDQVVPPQDGENKSLQ